MYTSPLYTVLGMDPGVKNWAYALVHAYKDHLLVSTGYMEMFDSLDSEGIDFLSVLEKNLWVTEIPLHHVVIERFILRHRTKGNINELVSMAIGWWVTVLRNYGVNNVSLVQASTWKSYLKRKGFEWEKVAASIHESDALGMAFWALENRLGYRNPESKILEIDSEGK